MGYVHILWSRADARPWWTAHQRLGIGARTPVWCDCCNAYSPAEEADARLVTVEIPVNCDLGNYQDQMHHYGPDQDRDIGFDLPYEEPRWETRCAEGFGCTVSPRRRASRHLRECWL